MEVIADLHLHSKYSRAVSPQMVIPEIAKWAGKKGINLVGTGDWTHPLWLRELKENLEEVDDGLYQPAGPAARQPQHEPPANKLGAPALRPPGSRHPSVFFLLSTEISSIYSQGGQSHRIHNLILAPNFIVVEEINHQLRNHGVNLLSDGRPITGLSSQQICEIVFSVDKNCLVIPAHAWTPWYSLYGSNSGFNSLRECFGEFTDQITAIETGLSSSPAMNWRIEELDKCSIVSFSDAHSPQKLGREATVFEIEDIKKLRYEDIRKAIINNKITYTIEFYPEEGKYHYTGHRNCGVKQSPEETKKLGETCSVCGRPLTVGVMHRVEELATRTVDEVKTKVVEIGEGVQGIEWNNRPPYVRLVPLMEILSEVLGSGFSSQTVENEYNRLTEYFGSEFGILLKTPLKEMAKIGGERLAEAMDRVRKGDIFIDPGYDGVFGTVKIWPLAEARGEPSKEQMPLF